MPRTAYVHGRYVPHRHARVPMEDRGHQFGDGVYEVVLFYHRRLLDWPRHLARLQRSLEALEIPMPMTGPALRLVVGELIARNPYRHGGVYLQVTRGAAPRRHVPPPGLTPRLSMSVMPPASRPAGADDRGVAAITHPDERWGRCDIKSIALLANVLARRTAFRADAFEALLVDSEGCVTEGTISTAYMVRDGTVYSHPDGPAVLPGVRKQVIEALCASHRIPYTQARLPLAQWRHADEIFLTSANSHVLPVCTLDGVAVADGRPGPVTTRLLAAYRQHVCAQTGFTLGA